MDRTALHRLGYSLVLGAAVAVTAACGDDEVLAPDSRPAIARVGAAAPTSDRDGGDRAVDLGTCDSLAAPAGSTLAFRAYAQGVQIYRWTGGAWAFVAPSAVLTADAAGRGIVGTHFAGPTWESNGGGSVRGAVLKRCIADAGAIPWLSLAGDPDGGPGVFKRVTFIQRVNTVGGLAPSGAGVPGEERKVPYTAEYWFYRTP